MYAAMPSITGKIELEYEGELVGGHVRGQAQLFQAHAAMVHAVEANFLVLVTGQAKHLQGKQLKRPEQLSASTYDLLHGRPLDDIILQDAKDAITDAVPMKLKYKVKNTNRSVGTKVSGEIAARY